MKKIDFQNCLVRCQAILVAKTTLKFMENLTGGISVAMSIIQMSGQVADILSVVSFILHFLQLCRDKSVRPTTWIDWLYEMLLLFCTVASFVLLFEIHLPYMLVQIMTIISVTLYFSVLQPKL